MPSLIDDTRYKIQDTRGGDCRYSGVERYVTPYSSFFLHKDIMDSIAPRPETVELIRIDRSTSLTLIEYPEAGVWPGSWSL